jgi:FkbM family methyltransferase
MVFMHYLNVFLLLLMFSFRLEGTVYYEGTQTFRNYGNVNYSFLVQFLPYNPIIVEAGAYRGEKTVLAAQAWPHHRSIIAFEPNPSAFEALQKRVVDEKLGRVHVHNLALNSYNGEADLFISEFHESESSLLPPTEEMSGYYQGSQTRVPCVVFDDWCEKNQIDSIDILRLELEGLEMKVLEGASKILKNTKIIIVESFFRPYRVDMCNYFYLKDLLTKANFVPLAHWYEQGERGLAIYVSQEMYDAYFVKCLGLGLGGLQYP